MLISQALNHKKIDQTEIEIFLSHLLGKDRSFVKAFPEFELDQKQYAKFEDFKKRRSLHEPLAYILGYKEFCGLRFKVDERVLIPRPETEELVNEVVKHVYSLPNRERRNFRETEGLRIADVGTGSGNIAISLAKAVPFAKIYAIEKDPTALELAKENIATHQAQNKVELLSGDLLEPLKEPIEIVVANLPYIPKSRFKHLMPEVKKWEPRIALEGGADGLKLYRQLFEQAKDKIKPNGYLFYEIDGQVYLKRF